MFDNEHSSSCDTRRNDLRALIIFLPAPPFIFSFFYTSRFALSNNAYRHNATAALPRGIRTLSIHLLFPLNTYNDTNTMAVDRRSILSRVLPTTSIISFAFFYLRQGRHGCFRDVQSLQKLSNRTFWDVPIISRCDSVRALTGARACHIWSCRDCSMQWACRALRVSGLSLSASSRRSSRLAEGIGQRLTRLYILKESTELLFVTGITLTPEEGGGL